MPTANKIDLDKVSKEVLTYLEMLLEKKGMAILPPDILADMLMDLYSRFDSFIMLHILENLDDDAFAKYNAFIEDDKTPEEAMKFLEKNVPNVREIVRDGMSKFEEIYLGK